MVNASKECGNVRVIVKVILPRTTTTVITIDSNNNNSKSLSYKPENHGPKKQKNMIYKNNEMKRKKETKIFLSQIDLSQIEREKACKNKQIKLRMKQTEIKQEKYGERQGMRKNDVNGREDCDEDKSRDTGR